jgi:glucose/arabinose dehydrogenase/mono/diheme cytochrome c family protein
MRAALLIPVLLLLHGAAPADLPEGFLEEKVASGITGATAMAVAPDGRVFICEQTGALRVVKDDRLLPEPFLAVAVDSFWERGLLGVALDPAFPGAPYVYVTYVSPKPFVHHVVSRFTANGDVAEPGSEKILLEGDDQAKLGGSIPAGHQGGATHFGKDGKLYIAIGEQTAGMPSQGLETFQGKILRINPDGTIPEDNPFGSNAKEKYRAIWALGLRNPFCFAIQPGTGRMFINDVGASSWEEIDEGVAGGNYGWPHVEGPSTRKEFREPLHAYGRAVGKSITGGVFYNPRVPQFPAAWVGKYLFADFDQNWIQALDPDDPRSVLPFATKLLRPVDLQLAPDGCLYVLNRDMWVKDDKFKPATGSLVRIRYAPDRAPKKAPPPPPPSHPVALGLPTLPDRMPPLLSRTAAFASLEKLAPSPGVTPYSVHSPLWSDGAAKSRWIALPPAGKIGFAEKGEWTFPDGTVFIKHFELGRRLETRFLVVTSAGGFGVTYKWRPDGSDADLLVHAEREDLGRQTWAYPGRLDCLVCHTSAAGFVLGVKTRQLNGPDLLRFSALGLLDRRIEDKDLATLDRLAPIADASASLEHRARSYFDSNCSPCHRPGGARSNLDLRYDTPLSAQGVIGGTLISGDLGVKNARAVAAGDPERSALLHRLSRRGDVFQMPPLATNVPDAEAMAAIETWIRGLAKSK